MIIPAGYGNILIPMKHAGTPRPAAITVGAALPELTFITDTYCDAVLAEWQTAFGSQTDSHLTVGPIKVQVGESDGTSYTVEGESTYTGTSSADKLPSNCAVIVEKVTARGGRRGRGRVYMPWWINEGNVDETGNIPLASRTPIKTAWDTFAAAMTAGPGAFTASPLVLLHSAGSTAVPDPDPITGFVVDPIIGSQRRRLGR
jgi:hypothetical protein